MLAPSGARHRDAEIAVCPAQRARWSTRCSPEGRDTLVPRIVETALAIDGVDLALWRPAPREGAIANASGELRFAPGGDVRDERGGRWSIDGAARGARRARATTACCAATPTPTRWAARGRR